MKIALVHDYLSSFGGAESVLAVFHELWPEAPIYTVFSRFEKKSLLAQKLAAAKIKQSWFGYLPWPEKLISPLRFLLPLIWRSFDFRQYDLVISSASWAITKGFAPRHTRGKPKEICYCHTPPRYLYGYETSRDWQSNLLLKFYVLVVNHFMRLYDFQRAQKVTWFIANSREVQSRIQKFYRRESVIIHPPIEAKYKILNTKYQNYFLAGGRLELAKNFGLIIKACNQLGCPLKIFGTGSQEKYLRSMARPTIEFLGFVSNEEKQRLLAGCRAFIVAAKDEDFGITPVEAMAVGRPVIAFRGGGYLETVIEGKTGEFFDESTVQSLINVLKRFDQKKYKPENCCKQAKKFNKERFKREIKDFIKEKIHA